MVVLSSFPPPTEGVKLMQSNTGAFINAKDLGRGLLYIAESRVSWVSESSGQGFSLEYPHISLHAISKDPTAFQHECLYLMLDCQLEEPEERPGNDSDSDAESETKMTEVRFVPEDRGLLEAMFQAMSACQALHPDPNDSVSEEEDFDDADEEGEYCLANAEAEHEEGNGIEEDMETGQFEDADPEH